MRANPTAVPSGNLEELLRTWGLKQAPFSHDERALELFPSNAGQEARTLLDTAAALRGVMTLTGSPGIGKSTLVKTWMRSLDPERHLPLFITQSSLSATGVLEIILSKLGERPRFKRSASLLLLEKHLTDIEPVTLILLLDDAQNYPGPALEEIRLLLGIGARHRNAFTLVLMGDEYLINSLSLSVQRALFTRISAAATLAKLEREEIPEYLRWHISRAGLERDIFEPASIDLLAEASDGNPRTLNLLAQAAWLTAARARAQTVGIEHIHKALQQVPSARTKLPKP